MWKNCAREIVEKHLKESTPQELDILKELGLPIKDIAISAATFSSIPQEKKRLVIKQLGEDFFFCSKGVFNNVS